MFVDDILLPSPLFEQDIVGLGVVVEWLRRYTLTIKSSKRLSGHVKLPVLGYAIGKGQYACQLDKIVKFSDTLRPHNKAQVKSFLV